MATDVFGKKVNTTVAPLTADNAIINWGGIVTQALNIQISYNRGVSRHRTIGNQKAVLVATMPAGQISIAQIITADGDDLFKRPGWDGCQPGTLSLTLNNCSGDVIDSSGNVTAVSATSPYQFTATGCLVTGVGLSAEAEGLTVVSNVSIDFLQLVRN